MSGLRWQGKVDKRWEISGGLYLAGLVGTVTFALEQPFGNTLYQTRTHSYHLD